MIIANPSRTLIFLLLAAVLSHKMTLLDCLCKNGHTRDQTVDKPWQQTLFRGWDLRRERLETRSAPGPLTAWPSVQLCTPVRHREVAGRWRDTWQTCAWGRFPGRAVPRGRCKDRLGGGGQWVNKCSSWTKIRFDVVGGEHRLNPGVGFLIDKHEQRSQQAHSLLCGNILKRIETHLWTGAIKTIVTITMTNKLCRSTIAYLLLAISWYKPFKTVLQ